MIHLSRDNAEQAFADLAFQTAELYQRREISTGTTIRTLTSLNALGMFAGLRPRAIDLFNHALPTDMKLTKIRDIYDQSGLRP